MSKKKQKKSKLLKVRTKPKSYYLSSNLPLYLDARICEDFEIIISSVWLELKKYNLI